MLADLSDELGYPGPHLDTSVNAEVVHASEQALYLFRLQIGATLVCWLADPNDPEIHDMLQEWARTRYMFAAVKTNAGVMVRTHLVCGIPPSIRDVYDLPRHKDTGRFVRSIIEVVNGGLIKAQVQSDIASIQKIRKIRVFFILGETAKAKGDELLPTKQ